MLLMLLAIVTASAIFVAALGQPGTRTAQQEQERTAQALQQAKEALIAWAANNSTDPGLLPCPEDTSNIGTATEGDTLTAPPNCGGLPAIGRLPWYALNLGDLRDAYGERLWYAVSPGFRGAPINSDTQGQLTVDGVANRAVAIIFSPGPALAGQTRPTPTAAAPPQVQNYLDLSNNDGDAGFVTSGAGGQFNDKLMIITANELFRVVERRVVSDIAFALNEYFTCGDQYMKANGTCNAGATPNNFFPRPAAFSDTQCLGTATIAAACNDNVGITAGRVPANPATAWSTYSLLRGSKTGTTKVRGATISTTNWFQRNGWRELIYYSVDASCTTPTCASGNIALTDPVLGSKLNKVVLVSAGAALSGQQRAANADKTTEFNYLEGENVSPLDNAFAAWPPVGVPYNDITLGIP
jgi:hypothetical protein